MSSKMLKFVSTEKAMPEKRLAKTALRILTRFMMSLIRARPKRGHRVVRSVGFLFARSIARCTTTSQTG